MTEPAPQPAPATADPPRAFCRGCGYALVGLAGAVCPECGRGFDLSDARTFARRPPRERLRRWSRRAAIAVLVLAVATGALAGWLYRGWRSEQAAIAQVRAAGGTV